MLLLLLGQSVTADANNRCAVVASAVCSVLRLSFTLCACTPRALVYVNAQPPRHGVIKRTIGGSLARSWPPPLPRHHCVTCWCFCCWACLLLLPMIVVLFLLLLCASVDTSFTMCARARVRMELPRVCYANGMRRATYDSLCCYSYGACGCCVWVFESQFPGGGK